MVAVAWLLAPGTSTGVILASTYAALLATGVFLMRSADPSCGCLSADGRFTRVHAVYDALVVMAAGCATATGTWHDGWREGSLVAAAYAIAVLTAVLLSYLLLTRFDAAFSAYQPRQQSVALSDRTPPLSITNVMGDA